MLHATERFEIFGVGRRDGSSCRRPPVVPWSILRNRLLPNFSARPGSLPHHLDKSFPPPDVPLLLLLIFLPLLFKPICANQIHVAELFKSLQILTTKRTFVKEKVMVSAIGSDELWPLYLPGRWSDDPVLGPCVFRTKIVYSKCPGLGTDAFGRSVPFITIIFLLVVSACLHTGCVC